MYLVQLVKTLPVPAGGTHHSVQKALEEAERLTQGPSEEVRRDVASEYLATGELEPVLKFLEWAAPDTEEASRVSKKAALEIHAMEKQKASGTGHPGHPSLFQLRFAHSILRAAMGDNPVTVIAELDALQKSLPQPVAYGVGEARVAAERAMAAASADKRAAQSAQGNLVSVAARAKACPSNIYAAEDVAAAEKLAAQTARDAKASAEAADAAARALKKAEAAESMACYREAVAQAVNALSAVAPKGVTAAQCLLQMIPAGGDHHPLTKELIAAVVEGRSRGTAAARMKATGVLQGMDRCLHKVHPGRVALQLAAWAVSAALRPTTGPQWVVRAVEYAHAHGIDVTSPLVEYILRRKY